jgi:hypothetical protein
MMQTGAVRGAVRRGPRRGARRLRGARARAKFRVVKQSFGSLPLAWRWLHPGLVTAAASHAAYKRRCAERARRRQAAAVLRVTADVAAYTSMILLNGAGPQEARAAMADVAAELEMTARMLRRAARLSPQARRRLAGELHESGMTVAEVAARLGVAPRTAAYYLAGRRSDGRPFASG